MSPSKSDFLPLLSSADHHQSSLLRRTSNLPVPGLFDALCNEFIKMGFWLIMCLAIFVAFLVQKLLRGPIKRFPSPSGALPLLGHLKQLSDTPNLERTIYQWCSEMGGRNFEV
jgi:hypothetical protein